MIRTTLTLLLSTVLMWSAAAKSKADTGHTKTLTFKSGWIGPPQVSLTAYGVYHFRKAFRLPAKPRSFIVHISADNRYQLYVNGVNITSGPQRSDVGHWRYDTLDLAPYLQPGKNILAVTVWNQGQYAAWAQFSRQTGLWVDGEGPAAIIQTDTTWHVLTDKAYTPLANEQHITGPFEQIYAQGYPWGWQQANYDDGQWLKAISTEKAIPFTSGIQQGRQLLARNIPLPELKLQRFKKISRAEGISTDNGFIMGNSAIEVAPYSNVTLLLDQGELTTAYPQLVLSGGRDCKITLTYAESLYADKDGQKGNRNDVTGKSIKGNQDIFISDGGDKRMFKPLYYRTFRYVELKIENHQYPLTINDVSSIFTAYPFIEKASFASSDTTLHQLWTMGWRTSRLCAYETYMDCPYYEQQQYIGDTRIQALISLYVSGDDRLMKNALVQFDQSRISEGLTQSRYPSSIKQVIPPFSLFWVAMLHDYWMIGHDARFVKALLPGVKDILKWHEAYIDKEDMLAKMPYWNFVDWPKEWPWKGTDEISGVPPSALEGNSAVLTLQYVYALNYAAEMYRGFGLVKEALAAEALARRLNTGTYRACWDPVKQMMADSPDKKEYSQHTNAMAALTGAIPLSEAPGLLMRVESSPSIIQCTIYYRFYLIQAFKKAGLGSAYLNLLKPWYEMANLGLTTFAERPEPTRSDCHAWSASPDYDLLATVCGITPLKPGFSEVRIAPELGKLTRVDAAMPHPAGKIIVHLKKTKHTLSGTVTLPAGIKGEFLWHQQNIKLNPGTQKVQLTGL